MTRPDRHEPVRLLSLAYYEAEFGPLDSREHASTIGPRVETTPAFMVWPQLLDQDDEPPPPCRHPDHLCIGRDVCLCAGVSEEEAK